MNFRTTMFLAAVLAGLGIAYLWSPAAIDGASEGAAVPPPPAPTVAHALLEKELGDIVKVACKLEGKDEWVFEKKPESPTSTKTEWRLTAPRDMKVVSWEVDRIGRELNGLEYEVSYKPGEPGAPGAADAGLDPPRATVTLVDKDGAAATVEIGKPASASGTYVRLAGGDRICVSTSSLRNLFKPNLLDYRDKLIWSFNADDLKRIEIEDRSEAGEPTTYVLARGDSGWMMESPVTARATSKVDDLARVLARIRTTGWMDDKQERLAAYGLQPAALTVRATVEEEVPVEESKEAAESDEPESESEASEEDEAEEKTETKVTVHTLHISSLAPIGEDTKTYMRVGDEAMVGTITKVVADKFKPVMSEWRDMRLTAVNVRGATRVQLATSSRTATLRKRNGRWEFAGDESLADESAVDQLLDAVADLTAVTFVAFDEGDAGKFGLDSPRAEVKLTIPGVEDVERIAVGGFTDPDTKRLVYVRRNQVASVAKVRASSVSALTRPIRAYRDRTVLDVPSSRVERVVLSAENPVSDQRTEVTFEKSGDDWKMTSPVAAPIRGDDFKRLVDAVSDLRAERIVAQNGEPSAYGLHAPQVKLVLTHKPPVEYRLEKPEGGEDESEAESESLVPVEVQPPAESITLLATEHDGRFYVKRADRPTIYEIGRDLHDKLLAEYRAGEVFSFDESKVRRFSIRSGAEEHVFTRNDDRWVYGREPDLPLDSKKVENLLLQLKDLRAGRYVVHAAQDLSAYGLEGAERVTVSMNDGSEHTLLVSKQVCGRDPAGSFYASLAGGSGVFLLAPDEIARFSVSLDELEAAP